MQNTFIEFIKEEKERGKTILLLSHIFSEIDATCDKISIIKDGHLISTFVADELRHNESKTFKIEFNTKEDFERFRNEIEKQKKLNVTAVKSHKNQVKAQINDADINNFMNIIS
jgi:ABC-2 type transport system ATP-binding protein